MDASRTIANARVIGFPRALVFQALCEAEHLARWWGPNGFTNTFSVFEPRDGGSWVFVMHGPHGDYPNESRFERVTPEQVVIRHVSAPEFVLTVSMEDRGSETAITWEQEFDSAEMRDKVLAFVPTANEENLDRLEAELARMNSRG
jgi:uncharacterized protein YndB with AHSA1/START domain